MLSIWLTLQITIEFTSLSKLKKGLNSGSRSYSLILIPYGLNCSLSTFSTSKSSLKTFWTTFKLAGLKSSKKITSGNFYFQDQLKASLRLINYVFRLTRLSKNFSKSLRKGFSSLLLMNLETVLVKNYKSFLSVLDWIELGTFFRR